MVAYSSVVDGFLCIAVVLVYAFNSGELCLNFDCVCHIVYSRFRYWYCDSCLISFSLSISFVILLGICGYYASCYHFDHAQCVGSTTLSKIWVKLVRYALENKTKHKSIRVMEKVEIKKWDMRIEFEWWEMRNGNWVFNYVQTK